MTGCGPSAETLAVAPALPEIPAELARSCYDPGVDLDAIVALTDTRVALAACRRKHQDLVAFYSDVKDGMQ